MVPIPRFKLLMGFQYLLRLLRTDEIAPNANQWRAKKRSVAPVLLGVHLIVRTRSRIMHHRF